MSKKSSTNHQKFIKNQKTHKKSSNIAELCASWQSSQLRMAVWESCTKLSAVKCNSFSLNFSLTCLHVWSHPRQCRQCRRLGGETVEDDNAGNDTLHQCQVCRLDFRPTWGPTWSQLGAKLEPSWDQKSNKIGPKSDPKCDHSSKMLQKSTQIGPKAFLERSGGHLRALGSILDRFWLDFGAKVEPSWL